VDGCAAGVITEDHAPQAGIESSCALHDVLRTMVAPCDAAVLQAAAGSVTCEPFAVQAVTVTQHALALHTPGPPGKNWSAKFAVAALAPAGRVTVQVEGSTTAAVDDPKQAATSKQPAVPVVPPSTDASGVPLSPAPIAGTADAGTIDDAHDPLTHVWPPGHVELTPPSASACAVPTQR
jgi:hypothetical protein